MATLTRISERNNNFQKDFALEMPRNNFRAIVELRKKSRFDSQSIKRTHPSSLIIPLDKIPSNILEIAPNLNSELSSIPEKLTHLSNLLFTISDISLLKSLLEVLIIISSDKGFLPYFISSELLIPRLISLFSHSSLEIKAKTSLCICRVTALNTIEIMNEDLLKCMVKAFDDGFHLEHVANIVFTFGNLSSDSLQTRDFIIAQGVCSKIINGVQEGLIPHEHMSTYIWCLSNLLRGLPLPELNFIYNYISIIPKLLDYQEDTISEVLWGVSYITTSVDLIGKVLDVIPVHEIFNKFWKNKKLHRQVLRTFGNISAGHNYHTDLIVETIGTQVFIDLLKENNRIDIRESLWVLGNIAANNNLTAKHLMHDKNFSIILGFLDSFDYELQEEALAICFNAFFSSSFIDVLKTIENYPKLLEKLVRLLDSQNCEILIQTINTIDRVLASEKENSLVFDRVSLPILEEFVELSGVEKLEALQSHPSQFVYESVTRVIKKFWEYDEIGELNTNL